jgi:N-acyl-D-amino-acid deacylase
LSYDIIIKNGKIIDGAGNPWYSAELAIKDRKIVKISPEINQDAPKIINAEGLIVCPGFIDMHSHTDYSLVLGHQFTRVASFIRQGITTCVIGMCGDGVAPIPKGKEKDAIDHILKMTGLSSMNIDLPWHTYEEYLNQLEKNKCAINLVPVVGYNNIRLAGGSGFDNREPTNQELEKMKEYLREAMEAGAFGMSTGLIYAPQIYAKTEELVELAKVLAEDKA